MDPADDLYLMPVARPCSQCPFTDGKHGPVLLDQLAEDRIPCHMTCEKRDDADGFPEYVRTPNTVPCVGAEEWRNPLPPRPNPWAAVAIAAALILAGAGAHWLARSVSGY